MEAHGIQATRLLPLAVVEERTGYRKSKLYDLLKVNGFPQPVRAGRSIRFVEQEVDCWIAARIAERDAALGTEKRILLNEREAAEVLGLSISYLQKDRRRETPTVPWLRVGPHARYDRAALQEIAR